MIEQIKKDQLDARKNKDSIKANLLTTLLGEASSIGKNDGNRETTDLEVVQVIKKFIKNAQQFLAVAQEFLAVVYNESGMLNVRASILTKEIEILTDYLPIQLTEAGLTELVSAKISELPDKSPKQVGAIMKYLSTNFPGQYDGQLASKIVKQLLD